MREGKFLVTLNPVHLPNLEKEIGRIELELKSDSLSPEKREETEEVLAVFRMVRDEMLMDVAEEGRLQ